jgi:S-adenosylmethionine:tRNA ribosyltransferase-isomerase
MLITMQDLFIKDYNYELPNDRIAAFPLAQRDASKLLVYKNGNIEDDVFFNLPQRVPPGSLLVLNNSRVIHARLFFQKTTGGIIEIFCLEPFAPATTEQAMVQVEKVQWRCLIGGASKWKKGQVLEKKINISGNDVNFQARFIGKEEDDFIIEFSWDHHIVFADLLHAAGTIPLPPYIKRTVENTDEERYQTVFAEQQGSVAAPTASLHFTKKIFEDLEEKKVERTYLTLHVGAGTFKPVKSETISNHQMHAESFSVTADALDAIERSSFIIAGGTTSLRALESLYWLGIKLKNGNEDLTLGQWEAYELKENLTYKESIRLLHEYLSTRQQKELHCRTSLLIRPGYNFRSTNALITNFHQPGSTLLLLVAAFIGDDWKTVYEHALNKNYRFLSYGDSSLLWRK